MIESSTFLQPIGHTYDSGVLIDGFMGTRTLNISRYIDKRGRYKSKDVKLPKVPSSSYSPNVLKELMVEY